MILSVPGNLKTFIFPSSEGLIKLAVIIARAISIERMLFLKNFMIVKIAIDAERELFLNLMQEINGRDIYSHTVL